MVSVRRLAARGTQALLVLALLLPAGCAATIGGMVVKHVAMSAAKSVAKDQYEHYKERKAADDKTHSKSRKKTTSRPAAPSNDDSRAVPSPYSPREQ